MTIKAVAFDIGGVLERVGDVDVWLGRWRERLGMSRTDFESRVGRVDPRGLIGTGGLSESQFRKGYMEALGLNETQADEFITAMWDWYCGELDTELVEFARGLRPAYLTGIISNSADGARREEQARYGFEQLVDDIVYSHEVGVAKPDPRIYELACARLGVEPAELVFLDDVQHCVDGAAAIGIHALVHRSTPKSIEAITALLS